MAARRQAQDLLDVGAYVAGSNPLVDAAVTHGRAIDAFLRQGMDEAAPAEQSWAHLRRARARPRGRLMTRPFPLAGLLRLRGAGRGAGRRRAGARPPRAGRRRATARGTTAERLVRRRRCPRWATGWPGRRPSPSRVALGALLRRAARPTWSAPRPWPTTARRPGPTRASRCARWSGSRSGTTRPSAPRRRAPSSWCSTRSPAGAPPGDQEERLVSTGSPPCRPGSGSCASCVAGAAGRVRTPAPTRTAVSSAGSSDAALDRRARSRRTGASTAAADRHAAVAGAAHRPGPRRGGDAVPRRAVRVGRGVARRGRPRLLRPRAARARGPRRHRRPADRPRADDPRDRGPLARPGAARGPRGLRRRHATSAST